jgi:RNA polymerase sigma-70 factor (sigma-E family)
MEFEEFARSRLPALVRFTAALCADAALAEDVVQEVLIRVHAGWPRIRELDAPEAYVRRALVNEYLSWRRKWARIIPHAVLPGAERMLPDHADQQASRSELAAQLASLPARQRAVLVMRYYGGLSDAEVARTLGCRPATVRAYAARGLAALRVEMTEPEMTQPLSTHTRGDHA